MVLILRLALRSAPPLEKVRRQGGDWGDESISGCGLARDHTPRPGLKQSLVAAGGLHWDSKATVGQPVKRILRSRKNNNAASPTIFASGGRRPRELAGRAASAGSTLGQAGRNRKTRTPSGFYKIYGNRFRLIQQLLVHKIGDPVVLHDLIIIFWLIQSHSQGGPGSPTLRKENA